MSDDEEIDILVKKKDLVDQVIRICRSNLKRPCKICKTCPFLDYVLDVMDEKGWKYNPEILKYRKY